MTSTPWTLAATSAPVGLADNITLVDGDTFVVSSSSGDIRGDHAEGLFMLDTRVVSTLMLEVDGYPLDAVSSVPKGPFATSIVARPHHSHGLDPQLTVLRHRHLDQGLREEIELRNHSTDPITLEVGLVFDADFATLFDVKAGSYDHAVSSDLVAAGDSVQLVQPLPGGSQIFTHLSFLPRPDRNGDHRAAWTLTLASGERRTLCVEASIEVDGTRLQPATGCGESIDDTPQVRRLERWHAAGARFESSDPILAGTATQAMDDLGVLRIYDPDHADRVVVAAGAPWFMALFGRDSILTAWMALLVDHQLAAGVLQALADGQGRAEVPETEEQPGKILHEVRYDRRSTGLLGGSNVYYGSVDATPLFVMLVAEYLRWTGDRPLVESLLPAVDAALAWMSDYGDRDGDGFIEYERSGPTGLANQGWKDSWDGIRYGDGRVATAPVALCEVQAYAYGALRARAYLAAVTGDRDRERWAVERADRLRRSFDDAFWLEGLGTYAVGLDGDKRPIDSSTSNAGHCLWAGIVPVERSAVLVDTLMSPTLFTGWGLRTLSSDNPAYNPLSYHCGSVWPHDTALATAGAHRYGFHAAAARLRGGLIQAAGSFGGRLPELFGGFDRSDLPTPISYPASCSPQAWAAAAPLLLIRSMLGLQPDIPRGLLHIRSGLDEEPIRLRAGGVAIGSSRVAIVTDGHQVFVDGLDRDVTVARDPRPGPGDPT